MDDPRFSRVFTDPRFKAIPKRARKVKIDSRFQSMFTDKHFKVKYSVDKRGRKVRQTSSEDLRKYYHLEEDELQAEAKHSKRVERGRKQLERGCVATPPLPLEDSDDVTSSRGKSPDDVITQLEGESPGDESSSDDEVESESSESSSTDVEGEVFFNGPDKEVIHGWGEGEGVPESGDTSHRLAACNMDWDRISAQDLFVLFSSFKPQGGVVKAVTIYPSDFGLQRMAQEDIVGPVDLVEEGGGGEEREEGGGYSQEKLRQYQLNRLKYYYAVIECDSKETAECIYEQCDGLEYEHSGGKLDLRFIPDGVTFEDRAPKGVATEPMIPANFKPSEFFSSALQQSLVHLTWDQTDPRRLQTTMKKFTKEDLLSMDFNAYLASSSEGEGEVSGIPPLTEEQQIQTYRGLLEEVKGSKEKKESEEEMEITWEPGLRESAEDLVHRKRVERGVGQLTPWERYLREKRERRRERKRTKRTGEEREGRGEEGEEEGGVDVGEEGLGFNDPFFQHDVTMATARSKKGKKKRLTVSGGEEERERQEKSELELLVMEEGDERGHFNLKDILRGEKGGRKRRKKETRPAVADDFHIDVGDPRFAALYESHLYAPDPANPHYKPTKGMAAIMAERQRRRRERKKMEEPSRQKSESRTDDNAKQLKDPSIIGSLVNSVKSKTTSFNEHRRKLKAKRPKTHHL